MPAKSTRIDVVTDFQHATADIRPVFGKELLDIKAIDGLPTVEPELPADGCEPPQTTKVHTPNSRR
jgi:hypothetical protein